MLGDECVCAQSCLTLCNLWTIAHQASLSIEFPRQEYWIGLPCPPSGEQINRQKSLTCWCFQEWRLFPTLSFNPSLPWPRCLCSGPLSFCCMYHLSLPQPHSGVSHPGPPGLGFICPCPPNCLDEGLKPSGSLTNVF